MIQVKVNSRTLRWYESRGYEVPKEKVQLWVTKHGKRIKHGVDYRVKKGTTISVLPIDLMPASNELVQFVCATCGKIFKTRWQVQRKKISNNCVSCQAKKGFKGGCHSYWVAKLITNNPNAKCDVSGKTDKRFLELHHLMARSLGGKHQQDNYVILSANYHRAFHNWMGGSNVPTIPNDYWEFKRNELDGLKPNKRAERF